MSFKDLSGSEDQAEIEKAKSRSLVEQLRGKQITVTGDFTPQTAGLALAHDGVMLKGGPFDGQETKVPRGAALHERPAAGPDGYFVPARYQRTAKRDESGLTVFSFQELAAVSS